MPHLGPCVQSTAPLSSTAAFEDATSNETVPKFLVLLIRVESDLQLRLFTLLDYCQVLKIIIETIPHATHRYPTVGDWFYDPDGTLHIKVSALSDWRHEALVAIHELAEAMLCKQDGVSQESVDKFDKDFEDHRHPDNNDEPGDDPMAPYAKQHCVATGIERIMAANLAVSWNEYADGLEKLP
jgi:hypothetical protein